MLEPKHPLIFKACELVGGQVALAKSLGITQPGVSWLINKAKRPSAEIAIKIERATNGEITKEMLRPDVWPSETGAVA